LPNIAIGVVHIATSYCMDQGHELPLPAYARESLGLTHLTSDQRIAAVRSFVRARIVRNDSKAEIAHRDVLFTGRPSPARRPCRERSGVSRNRTVPGRALAKRLELYSVKKIEFSLAEQMHQMWLEYAKDCLGQQLDRLNAADSSSTVKHQQQLLQQLSEAALRLDLTGARMLVAHASTASQIGLSGICVMETKLSFRLAAPPHGRVLTIPKVGTTLHVELGSVRLTLFASQLTVRPAERATKRFRSGQRPPLVHFDSLLEKAAADAAVSAD
ncbi:hypothetical protein BOX15_Mlig029000g1, partial [Macrostomum lignano]